MLVLVDVALLGLPLQIGTVRNVGWIASFVIVICTIACVPLALVGAWDVVAVPWLITLVAACGATNGQELAARRQHAELMAALNEQQAGKEP